jgi:hypothetical protein
MAFYGDFVEGFLSGEASAASVRDGTREGGRTEEMKVDLVGR